MHQSAKRYLSVQEYLALEDVAEYKSEYYQGEIFAMAGNSLNHNQIAGNVYSQFLQRQDKHGCRITMSDLKLWVEEIDLFTYPDLMVICNKPQFYPGRTDIILNPLIIIEVLSKSTEAYDRGKKFKFYRSLPSFQEYILIDQYSVHVDQFYVGPHGQWMLKDYNDPQAVLKFEKIDFEIPLEKIYHLVDFKLEETEAAEGKREMGDVKSET